jgi:hypothetical protein
LGDNPQTSASAAQRGKLIRQAQPEIVLHPNEERVCASRERESQVHVLIILVRLHFEGHRLAIHAHAQNLGSEAKTPVKTRSNSFHLRGG